MLNGSYYEATVTREASQPLQGPHEAAVGIIGGGFAGLATAMGLAERGRRDVVLLEGEQVGHGASGRNGGFVFGGYSLDNAELLAQLGPAKARGLYGLTRDAVNLIRRRIQQHAIACDKVEGGALWVNWFDDDAILERQRRLMADHFGVQWQPLDAAARATHAVSDRYFGALLERDAFHFHPLKYVLGLKRALQAGGTRVHEGTPALRIERRGAGFVVHTPQGTLTTPQLVVCGGGYLRGLVPDIERAMLPIATYVMVTEPLGEARRQALIPSPAAIYDSRFAFDYYRVLPDTRILWGGRISIRDRAPSDIAQFLKRDLLRVYPSLADLRIEHAWSGLMSYARHKMPQIGRLQTGDLAGAWYALSFGGHGVAPTTVAGEVLAAAIAARHPLPAGLDHYGLPPTHGVLGLAAAQATYSWYEARDWVKALGS